MQLLDASALALRSVKNVVADQVHRQERFCLAVERLEDHLSVVGFPKLDHNQLHF